MNTVIKLNNHGRGGRKRASNSKCGYTGWAWCRLHLRDGWICARDVIYPVAYNLHLEPTRQTCLRRLQSDGCNLSCGEVLAALIKNAVFWHATLRVHKLKMWDDMLPKKVGEFPITRCHMQEDSLMRCATL